MTKDPDGTHHSSKCPICVRGGKDLFVKPSVCREELDLDDPDTISILKTGNAPMHFGPNSLGYLVKLAAKRKAGVFFRRIPKAKKAAVKVQYQIIKNELFEKCRIYIDRVSPNGVGTNGNESRKFYDPKNLKTVAEILGFDLDLLEDVSVLYHVINSKHPIYVKRFDEFTEQLHGKLMDLAGSWSNLTPTFHKILCHTSCYQRIITKVLGPKYSSGLLGEESQETSNKLAKQAYLHHTYKGKASETMRTFGDQMMLLTDPLIQKYMVHPKRRKQPLAHTQKELKLLLLDDTEIRLAIQEENFESESESNADSDTELDESTDEDSENEDLQSEVEDAVFDFIMDDE